MANKHTLPSQLAVIMLLLGDKGNNFLGSREDLEGRRPVGWHKLTTEGSQARKDIAAEWQWWGPATQSRPQGRDGRGVRKEGGRESVERTGYLGSDGGRDNGALGCGGHRRKLHCHHGCAPKLCCSTLPSGPSQMALWKRKISPLLLWDDLYADVLREINAPKRSKFTH